MYFVQKSEEYEHFRTRSCFEVTEDIIYLSDNGCQPINIHLAGISYCDGTYIINRTNSSIFVFEYIVKGTGTIIYEGKKHTASEGDAYILHSGSNHTYYSDSQNPWVKVWINVSGNLIENLINAYELSDTVVVKNCNIHYLFNDFISLARSNRPIDEVVKLGAIKLHEIIAEIHEHVTGKVPRNSDAAKIKEYIDKRVNSSITIKELSELIYRSSAQTIRIFKKEYGLTPYAYLIESKVKMAKLLLRNTSMSIKQISYELSFTDEHYFSNIFKKITGVSPRQYRKSE